MVAMVIIVAKVMMVMVNIVVMVVGTGQDRTLSGQDRTKLIFKLDFPGNFWLLAFTIHIVLYLKRVVQSEE